MKLARRSNIGRFIWILALQLTAALALYGDVIYLTNGNILLVEKAWEEGDEVRYQTKKGIQSLPKSSVQSIKQEKSLPAPSMKRWSSAIDPGKQSEKNYPEPTPSLPATSDGTAVSQEVLVRLRANLISNPSDKAAELELAQALNSVASLQVAQGDLAAAQHSLEEALNHFKDNPVLLSNLATVYFKMGNYGKAEDLLLACVRVDSANQGTHLLLGEAYYRQEKIPQAISEWKEGLQLGPNEAISERLEKAKRESGVHNELRELKSTHFILLYDRKGTSYPLGDQILSTLEDLYRRLSNDLTPHAPGTVAAILYPDQEFFDITRAPRWAGGVFDGKIRIPIKGLYSVTPELRAALAHELTHCFMIALPGRGIPGWFLEGVAQVQEGRSAANYRKWLGQLQQTKRLIPLKDLSESFTNLSADMADLAYAEGLSAVEYLTAKFGRSAIRSLLDLMAQNYSFDNAFNTALQQSVSEFEAAWQRDLTK